MEVFIAITAVIAFMLIGVLIGIYYSSVTEVRPKDRHILRLQNEISHLHLTLKANNINLHQSKVVREENVYNINNTHKH